MPSFRPKWRPRQCCARVGWGDRAFGKLKSTLGVETGAQLSRSLRSLEVGKRIIARDVPVSGRPSREARYRVADPYLRFWLRFIEPGLADIERGRADVVIERVQQSWLDYRGMAIEPIVRDALTRLAASDPRLGGATYVGGWWPRHNDPEVDLVGVDRGPGQYNSVCIVGSIKWRDRAPFGERDLERLVRDHPAVPGAGDAPLVAVNRAGVELEHALAAAFGPADLLRACDDGQPVSLLLVAMMA